MTGEELRELLRLDVLSGARRLLGCTLEFPGGQARIIETEAYRGSDDPGCHAFGRSSMKNRSLFGRPGSAYVYTSYGIHQMLNVVCLPEGIAAGVLIRALRPLDGSALPGVRALGGPGKLARALGVDARLNGCDLLDGSAPLRIVPGEPPRAVLCGPRIGLSPGKGEDLPWRYVAAEDLNWISASRRDLSPESTR